MKVVSIILCWCISTHSFAQIQKGVSTYLSAHYNKTIYDKTLGNNPWGIGIGLQAFFNNNLKFRPVIELTGDVYLEDDKVLRINTNGIPINDVRGVVNLFAGTSFAPANNIYISFVAGPSFVSGQTLLGVKPSLGFFFANHHKWTGKMSYINIFNRGKETKEDFGSISFAIGLRLF